MKEERNILGLDIGAHKTAAVVYNGKIVFSKYKVYPQEIKQDYKKWSLWFRQFVEVALNESNVTIDAIGVGVAGILQEGKVLKSPNFSILDGQDLKGFLTAALKKEVQIDNDVRCFLRAESQQGAARGFKSAIGITLGTGVGGALLIDGEIYYGAHNSAGEVGHMVIEGEDTFEDLVSVRGFKRLSNKNPEELALTARQGDKEAQKVFNQIGRYLGRGLGNLVNIMDPEAIILGGGISLVFDLLLPSAEEEIERIVINPELKKVKLLVGEFKEYSVALGAALLF